MTGDEKALDQLSKDEQKEVSGGIPYEQPAFFELSAAGRTCGVGIICKSGTGTSCTDGQTCSKGSTTDPEG